MHEWPDNLGSPPEELQEFTCVNHGVMNYTLLVVRSDAIVTALIARLVEQDGVIHELQAQAKYDRFALNHCRRMVEHAAEQYETLTKTAPELVEEWREAVMEEADDEAQS